MLGAIIGDIIGSRFEFNNINSKKFTLFTPSNSYTDDTICTIATADAILNGSFDYETATREWCHKYPHPMGSYGGSFARWLNSEMPEPYFSYGNGSAMRISPIGFAFNDKSSVISEAIFSASFSHNHPQGIIGAMSIALAIFELRQPGSSKDAVQEIYDTYYNGTNPAIKGHFDETCMGSVPTAFEIFLKSDSFIDAIRNTMEWGGDSDTLGAIVGAMAEAYWGIPNQIKKQAMSYLPEEMKDVVIRFYKEFA